MVEERYNFKTVESEWQKDWAEKELYRVEIDPRRPKYYCLEMFPYPSGTLHMGHLRVYTIGDLLARFKRMKGFNVLHPMGWDAFGLPAENAAIEHGIHPATWTARNIANIKRQMQALGVSYDWRREVNTCQPDYYRWTQWLFLLFYRRGLAYRKKAAVNWCPACATVLANEQVEDGRCWRCDSVVTRKELEQWFLRITAYADRLLQDLALLDRWPERVRVMQENWIGRSEGVEADFKAEATGETITVFTTRADTLFGVTYMVLAPEHPLVERLVAGTPYETPVKEFVERTRTLGELARTSLETEKEGLFTGTYAINPVNGERVPIWVANYVLMEYGTGAVMGVPAHDQRDFEFAVKYGLPIRIVIQRPDGGLKLEEMTEAYVDPGVMVNSGPFDGLDSREGIQKVADYLEATGKGRRTVNYRIRDWLISRQRYWGAPIPIVYCQDCGTVPVPEDRLPVLLPPDVEFLPGGPSPLARAEEFVKTTCPSCGGPARRETDTMDTFICSSWYFLRYASPREMAAPFTREEVNYWMPVDQYVGGIEHAVLHLLYSRFFTKVLHDAGLVEAVEPFSSLLAQGMVTKDGAKMSKSKGNVVSPDEIMETYGADAARLFILFAAPPERDLDWSDRGIQGAARFLQRVWRLMAHYRDRLGRDGPAPLADTALAGRERELRRLIHRTAKKVTEDIEGRFNFNTAISAIMELVNALYLYREEAAGRENLAVVKEALEKATLMLAPMVPHLAEELWRALGNRESVHLQAWPEFDPEAARAEEVTVVIQVNGRVRDRIQVPLGLGEEALRDAVLSQEKVRAHLAGRKVVKVITVPDKLVNVVAR